MGTEQHALDLSPRADERLDELAVRALVAPEPAGGGIEVALEQQRLAVVERMGRGRIRMHPVHVEVELAEKRGAERERVDRRADVMHEPWQREFGAARATARRVVGLQHDD